MKFAHGSTRSPDLLSMKDDIAVEFLSHRPAGMWRVGEMA